MENHYFSHFNSNSSSNNQISTAAENFIYFNQIVIVVNPRILVKNLEVNSMGEKVVMGWFN